MTFAMTIVSTLFKYLLILYLLSSYKTLPGAYFVRFYTPAVKYLLVPLFTGKNTKHTQRMQGQRYAALGYVKFSTYASPLECDLYFHKNNATYFEELDISRCELMCALFQKLFLFSKRYPFIPVANVFTNYLKEIKPFDRYSVTSSVLCWDDKWIYIISRFTKKNDTVLCSLSLTKYVLKDGKKTIRPRDALKYCGIYNEEVERVSQENMKILVEKSGFHNTTELEKLKLDYFRI